VKHFTLAFLLQGFNTLATKAKKRRPYWPSRDGQTIAEAFLNDFIAKPLPVGIFDNGGGAFHHFFDICR
jgi:hypothetical protein